jgi:hypothetical protein
VRAAVHINNLAHQKQHAAWMRNGLRRHGVDVVYAVWGVPAAADLVVIWGWKQPAVIAAAKRRGTPILVMERAHLPPRMEWTSCGLNGLGNRGRYAACKDGGARWRQHFQHLEREWTRRDGYVLLCGQVLGDAALWGVDFRAWAQEVADKLRASGRMVVYRPHPFAFHKQGDAWCPTGAQFSRADTLGDDLAGAALAVTYNSTAGVEAVLAGVPTVTSDVGAMAWEVTSHDLGADPVRPDRTEWAHRLAWTSWRAAEIESGETWEHLRHGLPACATAA